MLLHLKLLTLFFLPQLAIAKDIRLYCLIDNHWTPKAEYQALLREAETGHTLYFPNDHKVKIQKILSTPDGQIGGSEFIVLSKKGFIYRLPFYQWAAKRDFSNFDKGYDLLQKSEVKTARYYRNKSHIPHYLVVQYVHKKFSLYDLLLKHRSLKSMQETDLELLMKLEEFMMSTHQFHYIADFKPLNIVYNGIEWVLIDWDPNHKLATKVNDPTVVSLKNRHAGLYINESHVVHDLERHIENLIVQERISRCEAQQPQLYCEE